MRSVRKSALTESTGGVATVGREVGQDRSDRRGLADFEVASLNDGGGRSRSGEYAESESSKGSDLGEREHGEKLKSANNAEERREC